MKAVEAFHGYCKAGKPDTVPKTAKDAKLILRFILPTMMVDDMLSTNNTGPKVTAQLHRIRMDQTSQTSCETKMEKHTQNEDKTQGGEI